MGVSGVVRLQLIAQQAAARNLKSKGQTVMLLHQPRDKSAAQAHHQRGRCGAATARVPLPVLLQLFVDPKVHREIVVVHAQPADESDGGSVGCL